MMEQLVNSILNKFPANFICYKYVNQNFLISFNNKELESKFINRVYPFMIRENEFKNIDFQIISIINDNIYKQIRSFTLKNEDVEYLVASFCTKESGMVRIKKYHIKDFIIIKTSKKEAFWILDNDAKKIFFIGNENCLRHFHREFYIFFEHIIVKKCIEKGALLIHAAAVEKDNNVILLIGNKRSGKTTTFFELCKNGHYTPLSVDKVLVAFETFGIQVYGVPTRLRVLAGTLSKYQELYSLLPEAYKDAPDEVLWKGESESKVEMSIKDFEKFAGNSFSVRGSLKTIIFSHVSKDTDKVELSVGVTNDNQNIMETNIFSPFNPEEDWWSEIGIDKISQIKESRNKTVSYIKDQIQFIDYKTRKEFSLLINSL